MAHASRLALRTVARPHVRALILGLAAALHAPSTASAQPVAAARVPQSRIESIIRAERGKGYDLTATSNGVRLLAAVQLGLAREAMARAPDGPPLLIGHDEYYGAYAAALGLADSRVPVFVRRARDLGEDLLVEYRRSHVVRSSEVPAPDIALTVCGGWASPTPDRYEFDDTTTSPNIRSVHERLNSYRLLLFDGVIVHDEITGIGGRATSGVLGVMFTILGDAHAHQSRMAFAADGTQLTRATARKGWISKSQTVMVTNDGRATPNVPSDRADLAALAQVIELPVNVSYVPFSCTPGVSLTTP